MTYGVAGLVAAAAILATPGFATADPPTGAPGVTISVEVHSPILGELTISPPEGTDTTKITVTTSAGCAAPSDGFSVLLYGPNAFSSGVGVVAPTATGFSTTSPITATLDKTLAEAAAALNTSLTPGTYRLVLVCLDRAANKASGMFTGTLYLTGPTHYQTTPPPPPTTTATTPATPPPVQSGQCTGLSYTGAAVGLLFLTGLFLAAAGVAFVLTSRRRAATRPTEEPT